MLVPCRKISKLACEVIYSLWPFWIKWVNRQSCHIRKPPFLAVQCSLKGWYPHSQLYYETFSRNCR